MKISKKVIVMLLAFILSVGSFLPTQAKAASQITLTNGKKVSSTIYTGRTYHLQVKGLAVKFYSSDKQIATINKSNGKLKALAPGKVTISAKDKETGKTVATKKFTVNQRATEITAESAEIIFGNVGETDTIKVVKTPATSTDCIRYYSENENIATVDEKTGLVTAKTFGDTTITVYSLATKATKKDNTYNKVTTVNVSVRQMFSDVSQHDRNVEFTFNKDRDSVKAEDFTIMDSQTKAIIPIAFKDVSSTDPKKLILVVETGFEAGKQYTLTYGKAYVEFTSEAVKCPYAGVKYTVAASDSIVDFNSASFKKNIEVSLNDTNSSVFLYFMDNYGKELGDYSEFTMETSNPNIVSVTGSLSNDNKKVALKPISAGNAMILIKYGPSKIPCGAILVTVK